MRPRLQLTLALVCGGLAAQADPPRVCQAACVFVAPLDAGTGPCPPPPPDERLEQALRSGATEVWLDPCRVVRRLASPGGSRCAVLEISSRPRYLEEEGVGFRRECILRPDGSFQSEYLERFTDAGWQARTDTYGSADGGAPLRVTRTALRWGKTRVVREAWRDGGWQVDSDGLEARPSVVPIQR